MTSIKRIGVFTSGGDAPGMNAAVRAVVRTAAYHDLHTYGIFKGYAGMIEGDIRRLEKSDVGNIIHRGGTLLKTARSEEFRTPEGRKIAYEQIIARDIDALVAIGGDGTFTGAVKFMEEFDIPVIGIPGTIDNDLYGSDYTIGFDTAVNTAVEAVDRIRDTADAHSRLFFIEVMGRNSGFIALHTGIGSGAGSIMIPERDNNIEDLVHSLQKGVRRKKLFNLIIVAEGNQNGDANEIASKIKDKIEHEIKVSVIGHLQRGGSPSAFDRLLASRLGYNAIEGLLDGKKGVMVGIRDNKIDFTSLNEAISKENIPSDSLIKMAEILAL